MELLAKDHILYRTKETVSGRFGKLGGRRHDCCLPGGFQQDMRRFLKSDEGMIPSVEYHIRHVRFFRGECELHLASQDGFTLYDTVCYNYRHNEYNGEGNQGRKRL